MAEDVSKPQIYPGNRAQADEKAKHKRWVGTF
jgi:hypothetical protein